MAKTIARWSALDRYLHTRSVARAAVDNDLGIAVAEAEAAHARAVAAAGAERERVLTESRRVVEAASGAVVAADLVRRYTDVLAAAAETDAAIAPPDRLSDADPVEGAFGAIRLGTLEVAFPTGWTRSLVDEDRLAGVPMIASIAGRNVVVAGPTPALADDMARTILLRTILGHPAGDVRVILIDPRGSGQGLAGFRQLPPEIRGDKVFVGPEEIDAQLKAVSATIETVLQVRLGSRHESLEAYNLANPAVAEPHRVVCILGLPAGGWTDRSADQLGRIIRNGPKAGVHVVASLDATAPVPHGVDLDALFEGAVRIDVQGSERAVASVPVMGRAPFRPDPFPDPILVEGLLDRVATAFARRSRALDSRGILPPAAWDASSADGLEVPIGLDADGAKLRLEIGDDPAHGLIGGMTGMGKSNLLHMIVIGLASRYGPDELEMDLLDFREGVGFAPYRALPHARAVALETEREFALSVLRGLQAEVGRRGRLFSGAGVDQFPAYRANGRTLPRRVLLIDEFQVLLAGDDPIARDAAAVLEDLVKRGRGFGVHVLLSSQSPAVAGPYLTRIYNQMGLRVALRCRPADALAILGEGNDAAARLEDPGEAIVNAELGQPARNRRVRVALLDRDDLSARVALLAELDAGSHPGPVTFEGATPARLERNANLRGVADGTWSPAAGTVQAFLGEPIELKGPTAASLERYPRANLLIAGADEEAAYGLLVASVISLATQEPDAAFKVIELARPSSPVAGTFERLAKALPERVSVVGSRGAADVLEAALATAAARLEGSTEATASRYIVVTGLHRWRELRGPDAYASSDTALRLLKLLDEGPELGMHVIAWTDTNASLERSLKRGAVSNFDLRAVLRVPESDSQNLLESVAASRLADNRALFRSEEWPAGRLEKFKPYPIPSPEELAGLLPGPS